MFFIFSVASVYSVLKNFYVSRSRWGVWDVLLLGRGLAYDGSFRFFAAELGGLESDLRTFSKSDLHYGAC